jgi:hypothetical protein
MLPLRVGRHVATVPVDGTESPSALSMPVAAAANRLKAAGTLTAASPSIPPSFIERPQCNLSRNFMPHLRFLSAVVLLLAAFCTTIAAPALADDVVFPPGLRIGVVPLVGLKPATTFQGFQSQDESVKVLMTELPPEAYSEVMNAFKTNPTALNNVKPESIETGAGTAYYTTEDAKAGTANVRRYSMIVSGGTFSGYIAVQVPEDASKIYTDDAIRKMFASAKIRKDVPVEEQLAQMPFKLTELANFKTVRTLAAGGAIILADGEESAGFESAPFVVVGVLAAAPATPDDRGRFAQQVLAAFPGIREARLTMSEPVRIDGQYGFETRVDAVSGKDNTKVTVVQWLIFGSRTTLRIVGSSPRDQWEKAFPRFRAVRDGIQQRG